MELRGTERRSAEHAENSGQFLAARYAQLMRWAMILARSDQAKAEEIVQEFCLYVTLTKPDFSKVNNLDGYLYTCLRHIYTSSMARASRDALRLVSLEQYDSFAMAVASQAPGDALQRQNDLRRACAYAVWRKQSSKTASYFILHFFHGYERPEVAALARVTMATIYNKLKAARAEVGAYLQDARKIKVVGQGDPPPPHLFWRVVPVSELFTELRETILRARLTACLPERELRALYSADGQTPIACELLAHIVSCEPCLDVVDSLGRRPTLKDREPLDLFGYSPRDPGQKPAVDADMAYERMMEAVQRKWKRAHDHRPRSLSIALNGEVIATYDVLSEHNRLSARIEAVHRAKFVEVFSEQDVRLALLPVESTLPEAAAAQQMRVHLSDARWLQLSLRLDGLGLESEVLYHDPTLSHAFAEEESSTPILATAEPWQVRYLLNVAWRRLCQLLPPATAWALTLLLAAGLGYWLYLTRTAPPQAATVLAHASQVESSALRGKPSIRWCGWRSCRPIAAFAAQGSSSSGRTGMAGGTYAACTMIMVSYWPSSGGGKGQSVARQRTPRRPVGVVAQFWDQELSAGAFAGIDDGEPKMRANSGGYEITKTGRSQKYPQLVSATLVLNGRYQAVEQRLQVKTAAGFRQLRFIQESYELKPSHSVSDEMFEAESATGRRERLLPGPRGLTQDSGEELAELEISILYALRSLHADTGIPIEVTRTPAGRVQVEGAVADDNLRRQIAARLRDLPGANLLDLRIAASSQVPPPIRSFLRSGPMESYEVTQTRYAADAPVRRFLASRGLAAGTLDQAVEKFSRDALASAQKALQHAYALNRLGAAVTDEELRSVSTQSQREWTAMVREHATGVTTDLRDLQQQLSAVWPHESEAQKPLEDAIEIQNPSQFAKAAGRLLAQVSALNGHVGELFTTNGGAPGEMNQQLLLTTIMDTKALDDSTRMTEFAVRLSEAADGKTAAANPNQ